MERWKVNRRFIIPAKSHCGSALSLSHTLYSNQSTRRGSALPNLSIRPRGRAAWAPRRPGVPQMRPAVPSLKTATMTATITSITTTLITTTPIMVTLITLIHRKPKIILPICIVPCVARNCGSESVVECRGRVTPIGWTFTLR